MMITEQTKFAIIQVADYCSADLEYADARNAQIVAEIALDANRLSTMGHADADKEVTRLVAKHGFEVVCKAAAKFVPTA